MMQIDEARRYDQARSVDDAPARKRLLADGDDLVAAYAHVANCIERGLGVKNAAAVEDEIVLGLGESRDRQCKR